MFVTLSRRNNQKYFLKIALLDRGQSLFAQTKTSFRLASLQKLSSRRRLVRHPYSIRASTNQGQGRGSILLPSRAAMLPKLDAGSGGVKPTSSCVIQNLET